MTKNKNSYGPTNPVDAYEDQNLSERIKYGLMVDRQSSNSLSWFASQACNARESKNPLSLLGSATAYRYSRSLHWWVKRQANAKLAYKTNIHKQVLMGWYAVMLDLLADRQPTVKDWKVLTGKDDRQTRRSREYLPHIVHNYNDILRLRLYEPDGSSTFIPPRDTRESSGDERVQHITTNYSLPRIGQHTFDLKVFTDPAYIVRQRVFWEDALKGLSNWMESGNAVRKDDEWLVRHMVNNDIAMHVIFDNLSLECEMRWFGGLNAETQFEIVGGFYNRSLNIKGETESRKSEEGDSTCAIADTSPGGRCSKQEGSPPHIKEEERAKLTLQSIPLTEDADGSLHLPDQMRFYVPHSLTDKDATKAVDEMVAFAANFEEKVPENLRAYMLSRDKMDCRMRDLILEAIAELGLDSFDVEKSAADAMILRFHECFYPRRSGSGSQQAAGGPGR